MYALNRKNKSGSSHSTTKVSKNETPSSSFNTSKKSIHNYSVVLESSDLIKNIQGIREAIQRQNVYTTIALNDWNLAQREKQFKKSLVTLKKIKKVEKATVGKVDGLKNTTKTLKCLQRGNENLDVPTSKFIAKNKNKSLYYLIESQKDLINKLKLKTSPILT